MSEPVTINLRFMARDLGLPAEQVLRVVELLDEGHPVPFIARYRKDQTGNLNEEQIRDIRTLLDSLRSLAERKQTILRSIESLGKLTPELDKKIRDAKSAKRLEDLYLPYKPKKQTLASQAREKGLEPLALNILEIDPLATDLDRRAAAFVDPDKKVNSPAEALLGAGHILGEIFVEKVELRQELRDIVHRSGKLLTVRVEKTTPQAATSTAVSKKSKKRQNPLPEKAESPAATEVTSHDAEAESLVASPPETAPDDLNLPVAETMETSPAETVADVLEKHEEDSVYRSCGPEENETVTDSGSGGGDPETEPDEPPQSLENSQPPISAIPEETSSGVEEPTVPESDAAAFSESLSTPEVTAAQYEIHLEVPGSAVEPTSSDTPPTLLDEAAADVEKQFQQWKDQQKEKGIPVVRSQKQLQKKREKEKRKLQHEAAKQRKEQSFERQFHDYHAFSSEVRKLPPHRVLAINRGEKVKAIKVKIEYDHEAIAKAVDALCIPPDHPHAILMSGAAKDAVSRLLLPALERELRNDLTEQAEKQAIRVFAKNLRNLLLQPPLKRRRVLALDPGYKHGCKVAALDEFGNFIAGATIYVTSSAEKKAQARKTLIEMIEKFAIPVIAIGNGTACRETEDFVGELIASEELAGKDVSYVIVNEAGASVYSASPIAKEEFPDYDILVRGTISIGRRLQDPLNELVKIEPASLGVGMYQHDLKSKPLQETLTEVVESCVNYVGVDLNRATPAILRYISGLNQLTAQRIYDYRMQHGPFKTRTELLKVPGFGQAAFTHAAGFLRIFDGANPLDATWIHPESYELVEKILERLGFSLDDLRDPGKLRALAEKTQTLNAEELAKELDAGIHTLRDVLTQLTRPRRDPREDLPPPIFKKGVLKLDDLSVGMELTGTILNVVDFGAFVDIGLHDSGLIHISHMADRYVRDAHDIVAVGDIVRVWVLDVDKDRHRISLTLFPPGTPDRRQDRPPRMERGERPARQEQGDHPSREQRPSHGAHREDTARDGGRVTSPNRHERREHQDGRDRGPKGRGDRERGGRRNDRRDDRRERGPQQPKVYEFKAKEKEVKPLTEAMKSGKEPLRGFGELAQLFGRIQPTPEEKKKAAKKEKKDADTSVEKEAPSTE